MPYLATVEGGALSEIFNNCRTQGYIDAIRPAGWEPENKNCHWCCCPVFDDGPYASPEEDAAPWANPACPESLEAYGFLIDHGGFQIEAANSTRRATEGGAVRATITGTIISSTDRGHDWFFGWLSDQLSRGCEGGTLRAWANCDGGECGPLCCNVLEENWFDADGIILPGFADLFPTCLDEEGRALCMLPDFDRSDPTGEEWECPDIPYQPSGLREFKNVRLRSIDPLDDGLVTDYCAGGRYVIVLELTRRPTGCLISSFEVSDWDPAWCEPAPPPFEEPEGPPCTRCGVPCRCIREFEETPVGAGVPVPVLAPEETPGFPTVMAKPKLEDPPEGCPPDVNCALQNGLQINADGTIDSSSFPVGSHIWQGGSTGNVEADRWITYIQCVTGNTPQTFIDSCPVANTPTQVEVRVLPNGVTLYASENSNGAGFCNPFCYRWHWDLPGLNVAAGTTLNDLGVPISCPGWTDEVSPGPNPFSAEDIQCIFGLRCFKPTVNGEEIGDNLYPFPLEYNGVVYQSGPEWAAAYSTERGCAIFWNNEFHPTDPCTYCVASDCPTVQIPNLTTPGTCFRPLVDGEAIPGGDPIPFPKIYAGIEFANGDDLAAYLSTVRGCTITWDSSNDTYCVPPDCPRASIINLVTPEEVQPDDCFVPPETVIRQACFVPGYPGCTDRTLSIRLDNTAMNIENAQIRVYEHIPGAPHILDPAGAPQYWAERPLAEYQVTGLGPATTLAIDGVCGRASIDCRFDDVQQGTAGILQGPGRSPALPLTSIGDGCYWVELLLSCEPTIDGTTPFAYGGLDQVLTVETHEAFPWK